ncbi:hypothetical protein ANN_16856 [Periplaneta americana]|uniref:Fasciclin-2 n=1 Tax=Periplaneta americana TaxID=6978 RepID=A0ABQ8SRA2_PERAM|nr:hypothetical protein ANN_16856 [Periplaneta americana]
MAPAQSSIYSREAQYVVHTPPTFEKMESSVKVVETETASVTCKASGKPPPTFSWIKLPSRENLAETDRFSVDKHTGVLTIRGVIKEDDGDYKCEAVNQAGKIERTVKVTVVVKPRIVAYKNISIPDDKEAKLSCSASGNPMPSVTFRKLTSPDKFVVGAQNDDHIIVENTKDPERSETIGTLTIQSVLRTDDGLYECIASNEGGVALKNGHLTVEFKPSFANTPMREAWSWQNNPVNLTCLAESIPNATITWFLDKKEINEAYDLNLKKFDKGPLSTLRVTPIDRKYYGPYICKAVNTHGSAEHEIVLKEAKPPSEILQAKLEVITATTITFSFMGPAGDGGLPTRKYAVQYKEERKDWNEAKNKTWPVGIHLQWSGIRGRKTLLGVPEATDPMAGCAGVFIVRLAGRGMLSLRSAPLYSPYILEGLEPQTRYNFRFAAANDVGFGVWAAPEHHTMPKRSSPEEPRILSNSREDGVGTTPYSDHFELTWKIPADNGEPIDQYSIKYCPVKRIDGVWKEMENQCYTKDLSSTDSTTFVLRDLSPDTHYKIELRAHNKIGFSTPGQVIIKTARGKYTPDA